MTLNFSRAHTHTTLCSRSISNIPGPKFVYLAVAVVQCALVVFKCTCVCVGGICYFCLFCLFWCFCYAHTLLLLLLLLFRIFLVHFSLSLCLSSPSPPMCLHFFVVVFSSASQSKGNTLKTVFQVIQVLVLVK